MNFDFSDDQKLLADQVQKLLDEHSNSAAVREVLEGRQSFSKDAWQGLANMGLIGTAVPEQYGGTGAGYLELCLVAQQVGAHNAAVPFGSTVYLVIEAILAHGSEAQKEHWLPKLCTGSVKGALAITEDVAQQTPASIECSINSDNRVSGIKLVVTDGATADLLVVLARRGRALELVLVDVAQPEVTVTPVATIDPTRAAASIDFDGASADVLTDDAWTVLQRLYDRAAVLYGFEQLGGAQSALAMAVGYAQERFAFGRAIGSFQAIKHMLADMYVAMKLAESNCYYAAWALANNAPDLPLAAATARVAATKAFQHCAKDNVQVHGGMGFTWEFDCHLYYRRSNYLALELGGLSTWEAKLVDNLALQAAG
jgi:alkylation response protein AidB-like acyl-CoA dehydrogenase